jgi:hypothetical protein
LKFEHHRCCSFERNNCPSLFPIVFPFTGSVVHLNVTTVIPFVAIVVPFVGSVVHLNVTTVVPFVAIVFPFEGGVIHLNITTLIPFVAIFVSFCESYRSFECNSCHSLCRDCRSFFWAAMFIRKK